VQNHGINKCLMVLVCSLFMVISTANAAGIDFSASPIGASSIDVKELSFRIAPLDKTELSELADGITGTVNAMTMVSTSLKLPDNQVVIIPNNAIWGNTIINITGSETRRVDMVFGIGYDDDMAKAEKVLMAILQEHPLVLDDPEPIIKVHELADSSVNFIVRPWVKTADYFTVFWDVTRAVKERFDAEAISIPYPQHDVHLHTEIASG
jgi:small conductance mechanosensitive channel